MKKVIWWQTKTKFIILIVTSFVFGTHNSCLLANTNVSQIWKITKADELKPLDFIQSRLNLLQICVLSKNLSAATS